MASFTGGSLLYETENSRERTFKDEVSQFIKRVAIVCQGAARRGYNGIDKQRYILSDEFVKSAWFSNYKDLKFLEKLRPYIPNDIEVQTLGIVEAHKCIEFQVSWTNATPQAPMEENSNVTSHCPVCLDDKFCVALVPCGHLLCTGCSRVVTECPICRGPIVMRQSLFASLGDSSSRKRERED